MGKQIKNITIGVEIIYLVYEVMEAYKLLNYHALNSFDEIYSFLCPLALNFIVLLGCYGIGQLLEIGEEIKNGMIYMMNCFRINGQNVNMNTVYPQNTNLQNSGYTNSTYQNSGSQNATYYNYQNMGNYTNQNTDYQNHNEFINAPEETK